ncbi:MAG: hypothetical protein P1U89_09540 [Verrucomicrobiales bacterium]|nr:hypothetical protein [Verrucomicrobiales bacterium]
MIRFPDHSTERIAIRGCLFGGILLLFNSIACGQSDAPIEDIRDIMIERPPASPLPLVISIVLGILVLGAFILGLKKVLSRESKFTGPPPEFTARKRLSQIGKQIEEIPPNKASLDTSEAVKDFLAAQYDDPIRYETAEEYLTRITHSEEKPGKIKLPSSLTEQIRTFMSTSQELKFAQLKEARERVPTLLKQAESIIEMAVKARRSK